ncbi:hypothetical protein [Blastococcus sp. SYSU D00813]
MDVRRELDMVATAVKVGIVVGLAAFLVRIGLTDRTVVNGLETSCSYTDVFAFVAAVVCVGCAWRAVTASRELPYRRRASLHLAAAAVLVLLAVVHVLRGTGTVLSAC